MKHVSGRVRIGGRGTHLVVEELREFFESFATGRVCLQFLRRHEAQRPSHLDQIGERVSLHFVHHMATVHFDGNFAGAELACHLFVE
jgi:hypothetical protein